MRCILKDCYITKKIAQTGMKLWYSFSIDIRSMCLINNEASNIECQRCLSLSECHIFKRFIGFHYRWKHILLIKYHLEVSMLLFHWMNCIISIRLRIFFGVFLGMYFVNWRKKFNPSIFRFSSASSCSSYHLTTQISPTFCGVIRQIASI